MAKVKVVSGEEVKQETSVVVESVETEMASENPDMIRLDWLPSQFKGYPFKEIMVRPLKVKEVKAMTRLGSNPSLAVLVGAHQNAIINKDVDVRDLYPVDFKFLMFFISKITKEDFNITLMFNCPNEECEHHVKPIIKAITLDEIDWEEMPDFPIEIQGKQFKPVKIGHILTLEEMSDYIKGDLDLAMLTLMWKGDEINEAEDKLEAFEKYLDEIGDMRWTEEIEKVVLDLYPDIKPLEMTCPKCGTQFDLEVELDYSKIYL